MLRRLLLATALTAAACRPAPPATPKDVEDRLARIEERLDRLTGVNDDGAGDEMPATADIRLLRVEQKLEKLVGFLKQAVPPTLDNDQTYAIPIDPLDPVLGPADAAVTLVEAYEYLCPYCAMVEPQIAELRKKYPKELRTVSKYYVIHGEPAMASGVAACAAARQGQSKFAALHSAMWKAIWPDMENPALRDQGTPEAIERHAKAAGLDLKKFKADVDGACREWLSDSASTLQRFGAGGTPTFWLNGRPVENPKELASLVEAELAKVKASGVAPASYYKDVVLAKGAQEAIMISPFE